MLNSKVPPLDKRIFEKEAKSLKNAGWDVVIVAPSSQKIETVDNIQFFTIRDIQDVSFKRIFGLPELFLKGLRVKADVYQCNGPDAWIVGVFIKLLTKRKITFDVLEHYPSTFAEWFPKSLRPFISYLTTKVMRACALFADHIILTKACLDREFQGLKTPRMPVLCCSHLSLFLHNKIDSKLLEAYKNRFVLIHTGVFCRERGSQQLLDALERIVNKYPQIKCILLGRFTNGDEQEFRSELELKHLINHVDLIEWVPFKEVPQYVQLSDVGLILFQPVRQNNILGLPNKLFDYMSAGKPVIAPCFAPEIARIVKESNCGLLVDTTNPAEIAEAIEFLLMHPEEARKLGKNGWEAAVKKYNWDAEAKKLIDIYANLSPIRLIG